MTIADDWLLILIVLIVFFVCVVAIEFDNKKYGGDK